MGLFFRIRIISFGFISTFIRQFTEINVSKKDTILGTILNLVGLKNNIKKKKSSPRTRGLHVEALEERHLLAIVCGDDAFFLDQGQILKGNVLNNDHAEKDHALVATLQSGVAHGSLSLQTDGSFTYTPTTGYVGRDSFTYRTTVGSEQKTATVVFDVLAIRSQSTGTTLSASNDTFNVFHGGEEGILLDVLANDTLVTGEIASITNVASSSNGTFTIVKASPETSNRDVIKFVPNANFTGTVSPTYTVKTSSGTTATATAQIQVETVPSNWDGSNLALGELSIGGNDFSPDPQESFTPAVTGNYTQSFTDTQMMTEFPLAVGAIMPGMGFQTCTVTVTSRDLGNGNWVYEEVAHWNYSYSAGTALFTGSYDYAFIATQQNSTKSYTFSMNTSDTSDMSELTTESDVSSSLVFLSHNTIVKNSTVLITNTTAQTSASGTDSRSESTRVRYRGEGSYSYQIEGGQVAGTIKESGNSAEVAKTNVSHTKASATAQWSTSGTHNAAGTGSFQSHYRGEGAYQISSSETDGPYTESSSFSGVITENGSSNEIFNYTVIGSINSSGQWSIAETGNRNTNSKNEWTDNGAGTVAKVYDNLDVVIGSGNVAFEWDTYQGSQIVNSKGNDNAYQTVSYTNQYVGGLLVSGTTNVNGNSKSKSDSKGRGKYSVDFGYIEFGDPDYWERYTGEGRWTDDSDYSYDDQYQYAMSYSGNGWSLISGTAKTVTKDKSNFKDDCHGEYTEETDYGDDEVDTITGSWGEGVSEKCNSARNLNSSVVSGEWQDQGTEKFREEGKGYTDKTINSAEYSRTLPNNGSLDGHLGGFERQGYEYKFDGTLELQDSANDDSEWVLTEGTGHNSTSEETGNSYDGEGTYTIVGSSGSGTSAQSWSIDAEVVEWGRIGSGSGIREDYSATDGDWVRDSVRATLTNIEELWFEDTATGTYTTGVISGDINERDSYYDYFWKGEVWLNEDSEELEGEANEVTVTDIYNQMEGEGSQTVDYRGTGWVAGNFRFTGTQKESETSEFHSERDIRWSLLKDDVQAGQDQTYSWKYEEGTLEEDSLLDKWTAFEEGTSNALAPGGTKPTNVDTLSAEYSWKNSYKHETDEKWELADTNNLMWGTGGTRNDQWRQTEGTLQTTWSDELKNKITLGGTTKYVDGTSTLNGSFTSEDVYEFNRELVLTDEFDAENGNIWRKTGTGEGTEKIDNDYYASGQNSSSANFTYTNDYETTRKLEYQKAETTRTSSNRTTAADYRPTYSPTMTTFSSTGWQAKGTGEGIIGESWNFHKEGSGSYSGNQHGAPVTGTQTESKNDSWNYTFDFTESKPLSANGNTWVYDSVANGGVGNYEYNNTITVSNCSYSISMESGFATLTGTTDFTKTKNETNTYRIKGEILSGKIEFYNKGTAEFQTEESFSYNGSVTKFATQTGGERTFIASENGYIGKSEEKTLEWEYRNRKYNGEMESTATVNGEGTYNYYSESIGMNGNAYLLRSQSEEISLSNKLVKEKTFENETSWSKLLSDKWDRYWQQGEASGCGSYSSFQCCAPQYGNAYVLFDTTYDYTASWNESFDRITSKYHLDGHLENDLTVSTCYGPGANASEQYVTVNTPGFWTPQYSYTPPVNYQGLRPVHFTGTMNHLNIDAVMPSGCGCSYGCGCGCGGGYNCGCGCGSSACQFMGSSVFPLGGSSGGDGVSAEMATISFPHFVQSPSDEANRPTKFYHASNTVPAQITCIGKGNPSQYFTVVSEISGSLKAFTLPTATLSQAKTSGNTNYKTPQQVHNTYFADYGKWKNKTRFNDDLEDVIEYLAIAQDLVNLSADDLTVFFNIGPKPVPSTPQEENFMRFKQGQVNAFLNGIKNEDSVIQEYAVRCAKDFISPSGKEDFFRNATGISPDFAEKLYNYLGVSVSRALHLREQSIRENDLRAKEEKAWKEYSNILDKRDLGPLFDVNGILKAAISDVIDDLFLHGGVSYACNVPPIPIPNTPFVCKISAGISLNLVELDNINPPIILTTSLTAKIAWDADWEKMPAVPKKLVLLDTSKSHSTKNLSAKEKEKLANYRKTNAMRAAKAKQERDAYDKGYQDNLDATQFKKHEFKPQVGVTTENSSENNTPSVFFSVFFEASAGIGVIGCEYYGEYKWVWDVVQGLNTLSGFSFAYSPTKSGAFVDQRVSINTIGGALSSGGTGGVNITLTAPELMKFLSD